MNLTRGINLRKIAELMPGSSGAEVKVLFILFVCLFVCFFFFQIIIYNTLMKSDHPGECSSEKDI